MKYRNLLVSVLMISGLVAQSIVGTVTDASSKPLEGANVIVVGTDLGAVSDKDGSYLVDVLPGEYNVIVSFIGYKSSTQSVVIGEDNVNVDFELTIDALTLTDVEVLASRASETLLLTLMLVKKKWK